MSKKKRPQFFWVKNHESFLYYEPKKCFQVPVGCPTEGHWGYLEMEPRNPIIG